MKKIIKASFPFKNRYIFIYTLLAIVFIISAFILPTVTPTGLSLIEKNNIVASNNLSFAGIRQGAVVNFPYHAIQKLSIHFFGFNNYAFKLPTILFAIFTGVFIILLLNRHFKNSVAVISSIMSLFSVAILFVSGNASPLIMYPFWMSLFVWAGSKLINQKKPSLILASFFVLSLIFSLYTPYMLYCVILILGAGLSRPHIRFAFKKMRISKMFICFCLLIASLAPLLYFTYINPETRQALLIGSLTQPLAFLHNLNTAFSHIISLDKHPEGIYLSPLFNITILIIAVIGLFRLIKRFSTGHSLVVFCLLCFSILAIGLDPDCLAAIFVPIIILTGYGLSAIVESWYSYFPHNPYAHAFAIAPLAILSLTIIVSNFSFFIAGYRYAPATATQFDDDHTLIVAHAKPHDILVVPAKRPARDFYSLLAKKQQLLILPKAPKDKLASQQVLVLPEAGTMPKLNFNLKRILTSAKATNSAKLYIYE